MIAIAVPVCMGGAVSVPVASADESVIHQLGTPAQLVNGDVVQAWTITNLKPSTDSIPYPVAGTLWEAAATDVAVNGTVQPVVSNLKARAHSGQTYWVLFGVATPQGVNPATLSQGQQTTGKVYFDVTGDVPDSVVYNAGGPDLVVWVQPPPSSTPQNASSGSGTPSGAMTGGATASNACLFRAVRGHLRPRVAREPLSFQVTRAHLLFRAVRGHLCPQLPVRPSRRRGPQSHQPVAPAGTQTAPHLLITPPRRRRQPSPPLSG
ncbi:MPT63 family protein [Mycobacterium szulgai]|uniref:MPT63 family protein n=1 Tax=Mycobacterium szulgai TaxID=1787 RepID=UPI0021F30E43|nr:MPT63 family protein [Mycobacterium szulgai]